jgi:hypothetical protein
VPVPTIESQYNLFGNTPKDITSHILACFSIPIYINSPKKKWMIGLMDDWIDGSDFKKTIIH